MKLIDSQELLAVTGGIAMKRYSTPQQMETFRSCVDTANQKAWYKPWTRSSPSKADCFRNLIDSVRKNPPQIDV